MSAEYQSHLEVYAGCAKSEKTGVLVSEAKKEAIAGKKVLLLTHVSSAPWIIPANKFIPNSLEAVHIETGDDLKDAIPGGTEVVLIDSGHLIPGIAEAIHKNYIDKNVGIKFIVGALDMDYKGEAFNETALLLTHAQDAHKVHAICMDCGEEASFTNVRIPQGVDPQTLDFSHMDANGYELWPVCREHHTGVPIVIYSSEDLQT